MELWHNGTGTIPFPVGLLTIATDKMKHETIYLETYKMPFLIYADTGLSFIYPPQQIYDLLM
jgi:hypothetical protein